MNNENKKSVNLTPELRLKMLDSRRGWSYQDIMLYFGISKSKAFALKSKCVPSTLFPKNVTVDSVLSVTGLDYKQEVYKAKCQSMDL